MRNRTHIFIDGQNFYLSAKRAFGLRYPDFDIPALGRHLAERVSPDPDPVVKFYIGMPLMRFSPHWTSFWTNKLEAARTAGVDVTTDAKSCGTGAHRTWTDRVVRCFRRRASG